MIESDFGPHALSNYSSPKEAARARGSEPRLRHRCHALPPQLLSTPTGSDSRNKIKDKKQFLLRLTCFFQVALPTGPSYAIRGPFNGAVWTH